MKTVIALVCLVGLAANLPSSVVQTQDRNAQAVDVVAGEILIKFKRTATATEKDAARGSAGARRKALLRRNGQGELEVAALSGRTIADAIALVRRHPAVEYAEPNFIYRHQAEANDPRYTNGQLWGMYGDDLPIPVGPPNTTNEFGSQAEKAWGADYIGSRDVYIGVIDTGIDLNHPDLASNIWTNPFDPVDGLDNDGNGYVDDVNGWDFFRDDNTIFDPDEHPHATHVAGTIGAEGNNGIGVAGVNWEVTLISGKFLGPGGSGSVSNAIRAIDYFIDLKTRHGLNIVATNNSWGGGGFSQALLDAIVRGADAGILFVAAAGNFNRNNDIIPFYPANYNTEAGAGYDAVISVAALTSTGARAGFSHYGPTTVDLAAPGAGVVSTTPNNTYGSLSGTSMATPHVSGAAALYAAANPTATAVEIKDAILSSARPTLSFEGIIVTGGRLDIGTLMAVVPPPAAPSSLTATVLSASGIELSWGDESTNEDGFAIERCEGEGCTEFTEIAVVGADVTTYSDIELAENTTYRYRVRAVNVGGSSQYSNEAEGTTQAAAGEPEDLRHRRARAA